MDVIFTAVLVCQQWQQRSTSQRVEMKNVQSVPLNLLSTCCSPSPAGLTTHWGWWTNAEHAHKLFNKTWFLFIELELQLRFKRLGLHENTSFYYHLHRRMRPTYNGTELVHFYEKRGGLMCVCVWSWNPLWGRGSSAVSCCQALGPSVSLLFSAPAVVNLNARLFPLQPSSSVCPPAAAAELVVEVEAQLTAAGWSQIRKCGSEPTLQCWHWAKAKLCIYSAFFTSSFIISPFICDRTALAAHLVSLLQHLFNK